MKYISLTIAALTFSLIVHSQNGDTTLTYLSSLNLEIYKNKPIDSFLVKIPANYSQLKVMSADNPKYARILGVKYTNGVFIYIYAHNFRFINPRSETFSWDLNLFRKEDVLRIEVWKQVDCYNGCPSGVPTMQ
jgi:hypothetical protein